MDFAPLFLAWSGMEVCQGRQCESRKYGKRTTPKRARTAHGLMTDLFISFNIFVFIYLKIWEISCVF